MAQGSAPRTCGALRPLLLLVLLVWLPGCFLPLATAAPQSAVTVGRGQWATSFTTEAPMLNLTAEDSETSSNVDAVAPSASMSLQLAYGVSDDLDLEFTADGGMYLFLLPIPLGASGGIRYQLAEGAEADLTFAMRVGYVSMSIGSEGQTENDRGNATYGAASITAQFPMSGWFKPLVALQVLPARVYIDPSEQAATSFVGTAVSGTLGFTMVGDTFHVTPFLAYTYFASDRVEQSYFYSLGLAISRRPHKPPPPFTPR